MKRFTVNSQDETYDKIKYWSERENQTMTDFIEDAVNFKIKHLVGDYDLPTLEAQRLNQILDLLRVLSDNQQALESVVVHGFDSLLGLTRGDNYLLEESGEDL